MSKAKNDPFIKDCRCCPDYVEACSLYLPAIHRRIIRELSSLFVENKEKFNKEGYESFIRDVSKIIKGGNAYFNQEKFIQTLLEED
jgi:hypothetical protein